MFQRSFGMLLLGKNSRCFAQMTDFGWKWHVKFGQITIWANSYGHQRFTGQNCLRTEPGTKYAFYQRAQNGPGPDSRSKLCGRFSDGLWTVMSWSRRSFVNWTNKISKILDPTVPFEPDRTRTKKKSKIPDQMDRGSLMVIWVIFNWWYAWSLHWWTELKSKYIDRISW